MIADPKTGDEQGRLCALRSLGVLDTAPEPRFDEIVRLVRQVLHVPVCAISLIDQNRQWFKAQSGLPVRETSRKIAFCAHTIQEAHALMVPDTLNDPRFADNPLVTGAPFIRSYAGVPLRTPDGYTVGSLCAIDTAPRDFSASDLGILTSFAKLVTDELELRQNGATDHLTGALSRRAWTSRAEMEVDRAQRYGRKLSLAILDIDNFRLINEAYGHSAGDAVITRIATLCMSSVRQSDVFGRHGGEEFVLLLPETGVREATIVAERIRAHFHAAPVDLGEPVHVTVSVGVAGLCPSDADLNALIIRADLALEEAKAAGRNCVVAGAQDNPAATLTAA